MHSPIARHRILLVGLAILFCYLVFHAVAEAWVFRTLPYDAAPHVIDLHDQARAVAAAFFKPDSYFQAAAARLKARRPHPDVVLVNIDNDVITGADTWPLPRSVHADILFRLAALKPKAVMLDVIFEWPQTPWVLEALARKLGARPDQDFVSLLAELNHDGRLKQALGQLPYVLIYIPVNQREILDPLQRQRFARSMVRHALKTKFTVDGEDELALYPSQRIHGVRDSILPLQLRAAGQGYAGLSYDRYGSVGQLPLFHRLQTASDPPRSIYLAHGVAETARVYFGAQGYRLALRHGGAQSLSIGERTIRTDAAGEMWINFYDRRYESRIPVIRAYDLLNGKVAPAQIEGKIVVLGSDSNFMHDYHPTPVGQLWGTEIHAYALSNILNGDWWQRPSWAAWFEAGLLVLLLALVLVSVARLKPVHALCAMLGAGAAIAALAAAMLAAANQVLSLTLPLSFMALVYIQSTIMRFVLDERQKRLYKSALSLYLPPQLTEQVADNPALLSLQGAEKDLTVLFSDIRGFTAISESLSPEQLTAFLHQYLSPMTDVVFDTGGTLDKYIGDAVMAFWGAPIEQSDHAQRACEAGLRMLESLDILRRGWSAADLPHIDIGIGINTGAMRVGNMGSDRRLSYTVMGDNVNLASRVEALTKHYGVQLIVSHATWERVQPRFYGRELGNVKVKGKDTPSRIYQILGRGQPPQDLRAALETWAQGLHAFRGRQWDAAELAFRRSPKQWGDTPARLYLDWIAQCRRNPPPHDWQAITTMTEK